MKIPYSRWLDTYSIPVSLVLLLISATMMIAGVPNRYQFILVAASMVNAVNLTLQILNKHLTRKR